MPNRTRGRSLQALAKLGALLRSRPLDALTALLAIGVGAYVVVYPFAVVRYPPITDFPFHASATSILRHYFDPAWGFQKQFTLHPLEVPYMSMYALGAVLSFVMPMHVACKAAGVVMLALLPIGLAVLFHGMKKSPLWGLLGLGVAWSHLTHWGFLNFMGAIGLFAMSVGFALMVLDAPTRARQAGLALSLLAVFFTHLFRFPFALLAVAGTTVLAYPATRRFWPVIPPLIPSIAAYGLWRLVRPPEQFEIGTQLHFSPERMKEIPAYLVDGFVGPAGRTEQLLFAQLWDVVIVLGLSSAFWFVWQGRLKHKSFRQWWWGVTVTLLPVFLAGGFLLAYLTLPMRIGLWWYVYPREVTPALYILLAVVPDMPKRWWYRLPLVAALGFATSRIGYHVALQYHAFDKATADFQRITQKLPPAPKLLYLVFNHDGSTRSVTPFIHLPAWVQAEKGGALSFHFIGWNYSPIRYRQGSPDAPPPVPEHWEWNPSWFSVQRNGAFFDWFLVRRYGDATHLFAADPSIHLVDRDGSWWLFKRDRPAPRP